MRLGTPSRDRQNREEIFEAWHEWHKRTCRYCVVNDDGSMVAACLGYYMIRLLYHAANQSKNINEVE